MMRNHLLKSAVAAMCAATVALQTPVAHAADKQPKDYISIRIVHHNGGFSELPWDEAVACNTNTGRSIRATMICYHFGINFARVIDAQKIVVLAPGQEISLGGMQTWDKKPVVWSVAGAEYF